MSALESMSLSTGEVGASCARTDSSIHVAVFSLTGDLASSLLLLLLLWPWCGTELCRQPVLSPAAAAVAGRASEPSGIGVIGSIGFHVR